MCRSELADWRVRPNTTLLLKKGTIRFKPPFLGLEGTIVPIFRSHSKKKSGQKTIGKYFKMQLYVKNRSELPSSTLWFLGGFKSSFKVLFFKVIPATPPMHLKQWRFVNFKNAYPIFLIYHEKVPRLWYPKFWLLLWEKFHIFDNLQNKCCPPKYSYLIF